MTVKTLTLALGERSYPIIIGQSLLAQAGKYIKPHLAGKRICIISDAAVADLHLQALMAGLADLDGCAIDSIILPPGEATKSFDVLEDVLGQLLEKNFSRNDCLIAFGGGVIGDLTGFAASILKRGCRFIQIPTTLLAQVDSAVGGKTAINTKVGKNLIGSFYQPKLVLADTDVLGTLPVRELKAGYGEVLKYGLINDPEFFGWLTQNGGEKIIACDPKALAYAIETSCAAKAAIVKQDEREHGVRALLNLGHTFAHALEARAGYGGTLLHGEAVSAGMLMAFEFSSDQGLCPPEDVERLRVHQDKLGLCTADNLAAILFEDPKVLLGFMAADKKNTNDQLNLILARGIGKAFLADNVDKDKILSYLTQKKEG